MTRSHTTTPATAAAPASTDVAHEREAVREALRAYLGRHGLKASRQRDVIIDVLLASGGHVTVDELLQRARVIDGRVSPATVYRTVKLLVDSGLVEPRHFHGGQTRYELMTSREHHDHLICTGCGAIVEFVDERIEALQQKIAHARGFSVTSHRMELYGLCASCAT